MTARPIATEFSRFETLRKDARAGEGSAAAAVAKEFEALFVNLMLKNAREASLGNGIFDSSQTEMMQGMFDQQIALSLAQRGELGIAKALERELGGAVLPTPGADRTLTMPARRMDLTPPIAAADATANATTTIPDELSAVRAATERVARAYGAGDPLVATALGDEAGDALGTRATELVFGTTGPAAPTARQAAFLESIWPAVNRVARNLDVPPEAIAAQAALETGWGDHVIRDRAGSSSFNLFGIKATGGWNGSAVTVATREYVDGVPRMEQAAFRAYDSVDAALSDYEALLSKPRYRAVPGQDDAAGFGRELVRAGYATDPAYADKLARIARRIEAFNPFLVVGTNR